MADGRCRTNSKCFEISPPLAKGRLGGVGVQLLASLLSDTDFPGYRLLATGYKVF